MLGGAMNADTASLFPNGSRWVRADFHLHTVADREFEKPPANVAFPDLFAEALRRRNQNCSVWTQ